MKIFKTLFLAIILLPFFSNAQIFEAVTSVSLAVTPEFPEPNSEVRARIVTYSFDLDRALTEWTLNGRRIAAGVGLKEVSFTAGPAGSASVLKVRVSPQGGPGVVEKTLEIRPAAADLLVEPDNFVPYWYRGGKVVSPGSRVKVVAIPHFIFESARLDPKSLVYEWRMDSERQGEKSGRGRQSFSFKMPRAAGEPVEISVKISSPQGTLNAEAQTAIEARNPQILFYEKRPLAGIITSEAITAKVIPSGSSLEVEAVPFFMNASSFENLNFRWNFDGLEIPADPAQPNVFLVKSNSGSSGSALLGLIVNNLKSVLEEARASLNIHAE
ncbi:MAG: hypothetical protein Q8Q97_02700 [bacterium]|nr:hypothetical protein [bacterium]